MVNIVKKVIQLVEPEHDKVNIVQYIQCAFCLRECLMTANDQQNNPPVLGNLFHLER